MELIIQEFDAGGTQPARVHGPFAPQEGEEVSLGRDLDNRIVLNDRSVSRHHACLHYEAGQWRVVELGSRFGSRLNGAPLTGDAPVKAGDSLELGRQRLLLNAAGSEQKSDPTAEHHLDLSTPGVRREADSFPSLPPADLDRRYIILLHVLEIFSEERSIADLLSAVIRLAGTAVEADRGFILLFDAESRRWLPDSVAAWKADSQTAASAPGPAGRTAPGDRTNQSAVFSGDMLAQVSQTVLREALDSGRTVFLKYAATDPRYREADSIQLQSVQSIICCPLLVGEKRVGAFYVDRKHAVSRPFSSEDGELLETIAQQAARALEKEQLLAERNRNEKLALLGTMVGRIAHELKNPLYNIRGTAENLMARLDRGLPPEDDLRQRLQRILDGLDKAEGRMRSLLRFARPSGRARERVSLPRVLTAAAVETAGLLAACGVKLERDYGKGVYVLADAEALEQVFSNLMVNAAQAMEAQGGGALSIKMSLERRLSDDEPDWVEVRIADEGPGIAPENLERIFADFFTTKGSRGGSGLGLALCRHLVDEHRGILTAENRPGGGALFCVGLPLYEWDGSPAD